MVLTLSPLRFFFNYYYYKFFYFFIFLVDALAVPRIIFLVHVIKGVSP